MCEIFLNGLTIAYGGAGLLCCIAYYPTIVDLYCRKKASANTATYTLWTITAILTFFYSILILTDILFMTISVLNLVACSLILFLKIKLNNEQKVKPPTKKQLNKPLMNL